MAYLECHFHSSVLGHATTMNVLLPQKSGKFPVLYLLHGLSDDQSIWMRRTSIERYADQHQLAVIMPDGNRGFYTDMKQGLKYWSFISQELPSICANFFPISTRREETFAAGLSMGGYGALKLALRCPDKFCAAVALSSVADIQAWGRDFMNGGDGEFQRIFGNAEQIDADGNNLFKLAESALTAENPPRILQICGTEDGLYPMNVALRDHFRKLNFPNYIYEEAPGSHSWEFWDRHIARGLDFLLENK